jgi:hypothetical protein
MLMTDEQIIDLVKEYFIEEEVDEDGYCWTEFAGKPDAFLKFARVVYSEGWAACKKCWDDHEIDPEND